MSWWAQRSFCTAACPRSGAHWPPPEGPCIDWGSPALVELLKVLRDHLKAKGAFALRGAFGPDPPMARVHDQGGDRRSRDAAYDEATPDAVEPLGTTVVATLQRLGFKHLAAADGFLAGQPEYVFQVPLADRTETDLLRDEPALAPNIKKTEKNGVVVRVGNAADLPSFHRLYLETADRDTFTPRGLEYFERMYRVMSAEDPDRIRIYLAEHGDDVLAATIWIRVGQHAWYSYGASTAAKRELQGLDGHPVADDAGRPAGARRSTTCVASRTQWREDNPHIGLIRSRSARAARQCALLGEWDRCSTGSSTPLYSLT